MKWIYIIQSIPHPGQIYVGITRNVNYRLKAHNQGQSRHTSKYRPWEILVVLKFTDDKKAAKFERYLKSGSG
jgi:predicted GIY-YIG superfamily endonuclease